MHTVTLRRDGKTERLFAKDGENLKALLSAYGIIIGGCCRGTCGKCKIRLLSGFVNGDVPDEQSLIRACRSTVNSSISIAPLNADSFYTSASQFAENTSNIPVFAALDIGTTTIVLRALDEDGTPLSETSIPNPQSIFGADVISRINASEHSLDELCSLLADSIFDLIKRAFGDLAPKRVAIAANTVMQYFLCGKDPTPLGRHPLPNISHSALLLKPTRLHLPARTETLLLPSISPFVGGDIVAGIISLPQHLLSSPTLLCDLGTNGELALIEGGRIYTASAAAGPAFEGSGIEMGMPYGHGAIDKVEYKNGDFDIRIVGNTLPMGICGSGLATAAAALLDAGIINEKGNFVKASPRLRDSKFYFSANVYITEKDISALLLAKSAIRTAYDMLVDHSGISPAQILVSGAFGGGTDCSSLSAISMFPSDIPISSIGNSALDGASAALMSSEKLEEAQRIAESATNIDLALDPAFQRKYIDNLKF